MDKQTKDPAAEIRALIAQLEGETDPECVWVVRLLKEALADIERKQGLRDLARTMSTSVVVRLPIDK